MKKNTKLVAKTVLLTLACVIVIGIGSYFTLLRPGPSIRYQMDADIVIHLSQDEKITAFTNSGVQVGEDLTSFDQLVKVLETDSFGPDRDLAVLELPKFYSGPLDEEGLKTLQEPLRKLGFKKVVIMRVTSKGGWGYGILAPSILELLGGTVKYPSSPILME